MAASAAAAEIYRFLYLQQKPSVTQKSAGVCRLPAEIYIITHHTLFLLLTPLHLMNQCASGKYS